MAAIANDARFWNGIARKYAADPIADTAGYERTLAHTRRYLAPTHTVLEIGCGTGTTALQLAPNVERLVASDISAEMVAIAREKAAAAGCVNASFEVATPDAAPWPDATFDAALAFNLLHLVAARQAALAGVHRLLKPGGLFISKTPCLKELNPLIRLAVPMMQVVGKAPHVAFFSSEEIEREIVAAGFEIVERARHGSRGKDARPYLVARKT
ncbi:MAG TPA: class I SAM-dependent methyltransferase [Vitreimonas sp.]|uniref:class I SAM-dependent methyltransferase n=1 Tax=Vitreimonas sp. TaxID=3069702 RepID=UPI002D3E47A3|nr:class I SAM-dependent methyltransferase [Vitreimonas sp.]HYD87675.1 class I SAM-dependent methyltransferase [Vitreimonas sp.]